MLLKEKIVNLELPPASVLNEAGLMAELRLGRTPIREALQRLALESLVIILPRRGTIVADVNASDLQKIFEIRIELETYAARLAATRATPKQITAMEALFADSADFIERGNNKQLIQLDHEAHRQLWQATQNEFLQDSLDRLYTHVLRLWYVSLHEVSSMQAAIQEHIEILAALRNRDGARAADIMRRHVKSFQQEFEQAAFLARAA